MHRASTARRSREEVTALHLAESLAAHLEERGWVGVDPCIHSPGPSIALHSALARHSCSACGGVRWTCASSSRSLPVERRPPRASPRRPVPDSRQTQCGRLGAIGSRRRPSRVRSVRDGSRAFGDTSSTRRPDRGIAQQIARRSSRCSSWPTATWTGRWALAARLVAELRGDLGEAASQAVDEHIKNPLAFMVLLALSGETSNGRINVRSLRGSCSA
jgi:hypothetical protein